MIKLIKNILPKEKEYFFAISMGVDSVAGYLFLKNKGYTVHPIHFNHKLRIQNDNMENKFVELCNSTNEKPIIGYGENLQTEADCRNARLNFYKKYCSGGIIITAHHIDDYVESYLLNCFRGHPNREPFSLESQFDNFKIIHPFLLTRKKDFKQYLDRNNYLCYTIEDESNSSIKGSRRNWIRKQIVPEMIKNKLSLEKFAERKIGKLLSFYSESSSIGQQHRSHKAGVVGSSPTSRIF
jgi:tRNA(Ile)-lysidine synthetase-like protein